MQVLVCLVARVAESRRAVLGDCPAVMAVMAVEAGPGRLAAGGTLEGLLVGGRPRLGCEVVSARGALGLLEVGQRTQAAKAGLVLFFEKTREVYDYSHKDHRSIDLYDLYD